MCFRIPYDIILSAYDIGQIPFCKVCMGHVTVSCDVYHVISPSESHQKEKRIESPPSSNEDLIKLQDRLKQRDDEISILNHVANYVNHVICLLNSTS